MRSLGRERKSRGSSGLVILGCFVLVGILLIFLAFARTLLVSPLPLSDKDVSTTYTAQTDWGSSTPVLHPNHTFDQIVIRSDNTQSRTSGSWQMKLTDGGEGVNGIVIFKPFLSVRHDYAGVPEQSAAPSIARLGSGGIEIAADPDYGIEFESR
jgi:hypothetical protein